VTPPAHRPALAALARIALALASWGWGVAFAQPVRLATHAVRLDADGKIVSWFVPQERAYGFVASAPWGYLASIPVQPNGLPTYYTYPTFDPTTGGPGSSPFHNPAGLNAMLADGAIAHYAYSGDWSVVDLVRGLLDHHRTFGSTPEDWPWASVPYASSEPGAVRYAGGDDAKPTGNGPGGGDGLSVIEPDKVGELGLGYLRFWQLTGEQPFLEAALACGHALAVHVRAGDATHSPWPFRVRADTDAIVEEYTANAVGPIKLLDALVRLGLGDVERYRSAADAAWAWVLAYPLQTGWWSAYFEDVPTQPDPSFNLDQYIPMETARFVLLHPERDPAWRDHAAQLIGFVERTFASDVVSFGIAQRGQQFGATTISEQVVDMDKMGSHTSRYASVLALWAERAGDAAAREKAFRSLNWATYMCGADGVVDVGDNFAHWFTDGYGDYTRHFLAAMGAMPAWAPPGEAHVLRSSSVVRRVSYDLASVSYVTYDRDSTEVLRLPRPPAGVKAGGVAIAARQDLAAEGFTVEPLADGDVAVRVRHGARDVVIDLNDAPRAGGGGCSAAGGGVAWTLLGSALLAWGVRLRATSCRRRAPVNGS
jgi:hypothetical protein